MSTRLCTKPLFDPSCLRCQPVNLVRKCGPENTRVSTARKTFGARFYATDAPKLNYVVLTGRSLISLDGPDATDFLHNLIPAPVLPLNDASGSCIATAFLNAKGRIIHDAFLYKPTKTDSHRWFLEVDANSAPAVLKHLKKHKLRTKVKLQQLSSEEAAVFYLWPRSSDPTRTEGLVLRQDPRPKMGRRGYLLGENATQRLKDTLGEESSKEEYHWEDYMIHRILNGHAEGPIEILSEHALPQESNFDFYGGIDFHKGCYLGQELTIRTHHTGVVRKRILPVQLYTDERPISKDQTRPQYDPLTSLPQPPHEANIAKCGARGRSARSTGKWLGGYGNIGLALCRLETMTDLSLTAEGSQFNQEADHFEVAWQDGTSNENNSVKVKAFVPPWLRQAIDDSVKARSERSQARRKKDLEDDDDDEVD
ncbi:ccr4 associated factor [Lithohypha guttulata]|uniref:ccr4 associated factor n=1 Tax=Lithohypha guttulata TaxID=1690604 RepID=UPI002DDDDCFB|nr:ccr4 associated factor [Lithohypha guttulata]KAK5103819.1 ccr4 associated factor [Lithohypha guttulata]